MSERHKSEVWTDHLGKERWTCAVCEQDWPCATANVVALIALDLFYERAENTRAAWDHAEQTAMVLSQSFPVCVGMADG